MRFLAKILSILGFSACSEQPFAENTSPDKRTFNTSIVVLSASPDTPQCFGYKDSWFALPTKDTTKVADFLQIRKRVSANWESGLFYRSAPYEGHYENSDKRVFITPPVCGWTFVITDLNHTADTIENINVLESLLMDLSLEFGEAQYYGSYRVFDYASWYRVVSGKIVRGYSFVGGANGYYVNIGQTTPAESALGFGDISGVSVNDLNVADHLPEDKDGLTIWPDEEHPALIAEAWSINPLRLDEFAEKGVGILGLLPKN